MGTMGAFSLQGFGFEVGIWGGRTGRYRRVGCSLYSPAMSRTDLDSIPGQRPVLLMKNPRCGRGKNLPEVTHPILGSRKETWVLD